MPQFTPRQLKPLVYSGVGVSFAVTVGICAWVGYEADEWLGTAPWLLIVGVFLGLFTATWELLLLMKKVERSLRD